MAAGTASTAMDQLGQAANIIQVLDATYRVFGQITEIAAKIIKFPERSRAIIQRCSFDSDTIKHLIEIVKTNPQLFQSVEEISTIEKTFYDLQIQLIKARLELEPYRQDGVVQRLRWGLVGEAGLQVIERELFQWSQRLYNRFSVMVMRLQGVLASPSKTVPLLQIPEILSQHRMQQLVADAAKVERSKLVRDAQKDDIVVSGTPSSLMTGTIRSDTKSQPIVIEWKPYGGGDKDEVEEGVAKIAAILEHVQPNLMNILHGCGYFHDAAHARFGLLYQTPAMGSSIVTLDALIDKQPVHSLPKRFQLAQRITSAVLFLHGTGFVHHGIRTRKVLVFPEPGANHHTKLGDAYLSGLEESRTLRGRSSLTETGSWQTRIFRHPERHGSSNNQYFTTVHDIYALGVVLLEIGMWQPLARQRLNGALVFEKADPQMTKKILLAYADTLDRYVGPTYKRVVRQCLEVDEGSAGGMKLLSEVLGHLEVLGSAL